MGADLRLQHTVSARMHCDLLAPGWRLDASALNGYPGLTDSQGDLVSVCRD